MTVVFTKARGFHSVAHAGYFVKIIDADTAHVLKGRPHGEIIEVTTVAKANALADKLNSSCLLRCAEDSPLVSGERDIRQFQG